MPVMRCTRNGIKGYKFGKSGFCYLGPQAKSKAAKQGAAIKISQSRSDQSEFFKNKIIRYRAQLGKTGKKIGRPPKWLFPTPVELFYKRELFDFVKNIENKTRQILFPFLDDLVKQYELTIADSARADGWSDEAGRLIDSLNTSITNTPPFDPPTMTLNVGQFTSDWNDNQWRKVMRGTVGVDPFAREPWLNDVVTSFSKENVALIKSIQDKAVTDIEGMVQRGIKQGQRAETIRKQVEGQFGTTRARAKLIARDQVAKLNGQLTERRQTALGIQEYIWRTSLDERVRQSHRTKEGKKFRWDKPPLDTGHPGEDYQCRCVAEPVFGDLLSDEVAVVDPITAVGVISRAVVQTRKPKAAAKKSEEIKTAADVKKFDDIEAYIKYNDIANSVEYSGGRTWGGKISQAAALEKFKIIFDEMERFKAAYPKLGLPKVNKFYVTKAVRGRAHAGFRDSMRASISFSNEWSAKAWKNIEDWEKRMNRPWDWIKKEDHRRIVVRHEYAHILQGKYGIEQNSEWLKLKAKYDRAWRRQNVSDYGGKKSIEFFTESFSHYTSPYYSETKALPKDMTDFFDKILSGGL